VAVQARLTVVPRTRYVYNNGLLDSQKQYCGRFGTACGKHRLKAADELSRLSPRLVNEGLGQVDVPLVSLFPKDQCEALGPKSEPLEGHSKRAHGH
jgi:hypothetical protein